MLYIKMITLIPIMNMLKSELEAVWYTKALILMPCVISGVVVDHSVIFIKTTNNSHGHLIFIVNNLSIVWADIETVLVAPGLDKLPLCILFLVTDHVCVINDPSV